MKANKCVFGLETFPGIGCSLSVHTAIKKKKEEVINHKNHHLTHLVLTADHIRATKTAFYSQAKYSV